jgi:hypothetical protein
MPFTKTGIGTSLGVVPVDTTPKTAGKQPATEPAPKPEGTNQAGK